MRILRVLFLLVLCFAFLSQNASAQAGSLAAFLVALQEVKQTLESTIHTVDTAAAERLNQLNIELDKAIAGVQVLIDKGKDAVDAERESTFANVADVMSKINNEVNSKGYIAYQGVNSTLVNFARIANAVPGFSVPTYSFGVEPLRIRRDAKDRTVFVYGFFPHADDAHPVVVRVGGKEVPAKTYSDNRIGFELPAGTLATDEHFVNFEMVVPDGTNFFVFKKTRTINGRVYVAKNQPFTFTVTSKRTNPDLWVDVVPMGVLTRRADSNLTSFVGVRTAPEVFSELVNDDVKYDMSSAFFKAMAYPSITQGVCPCPGCTPSSAQANWTSSQISWNLSAPNCAAHYVFKSVFNQWYCGGGGTHADVSFKPTFRVKRRDVPAEIVSSEQTFALDPGSASTPMAPVADWTSITVKGVFSDGDEHQERIVYVTPGVRVANSDLWKASILPVGLVVQTRD
ncbi:hypothetical protein [Burkholderia ubonensis]|uniref:hypothetical protein n=1 Tax=Burkholderia ubonensis TaxID=101571 RepID=UPI002ABDADB8|nr:hypothetical protein [Burkholderia ubonensis]